MNWEHIKHELSKIPIHLVIIGIIIIWLIPTFGLLVTSFRPVQDVNTTGWWTVLQPPTGSAEYGRLCLECHGANGQEIETADLSDPELIGQYPTLTPAFSHAAAGY
jgi:ABC-type glycerol-3-phosphate transport system permease component